MNIIRSIAVILFSLVVTASQAADHHFGDSLTTGTGASVPANAYVPLLDTALGVPTINHALISSAAADQAIVAHNIHPAATDKVTLMIGVNDCQRYFTAQQQGEYRAFVSDIVAATALPNVIYGQSASITRTGSWLNMQSPWAHGLQSLTNGNALTTTVSGSKIFIGTQLQEYQGQAVTGAANVIIDGVNVGSFSSNGLGMGTGLGAVYAPGVFMFSAGSAGSHSVQIVQVPSANASGVALNSLYVEFIAGSDQPAAAPFYLSNVTRTFQINDPCTPALNAAFNTIIAGIVSDFQSAGRNVILVDSNSVITQSDLISDNIHLNDSGHLKVKTQFFNAMTGGTTFTTAPVYQRLINGTSDGTFWIDDGAARKQLTVQ